MKQINKLIVAFAVAILATFTAQAADFKPAVIYDMGGKFDKSFNEGVYNGIKRFQDETGVKVMEFEVTNETQREQAMRRMVQRGATVVLGVGFAQADAIDKVAAENRIASFPSSTLAGWISPTCDSMPSRNMKVVTSSVWPQPWPPRPVPLASSAAWTFR